MTINFKVSILLLLKYLFILFVVLVPFDNYKISFISASNLMILCSIPLLFVLKDELKINNTYLKNSLYIFLGIIIISIITLVYIVFDNTDFEKKLRSLVFLLFIAIFIIDSLILASNKYIDINLILKCLLWSCFISTFFGYLELFYFLFFKRFLFEPVLLNGIIRIKGVYFDPNYFSVMPALGMFSSIALKIEKKTKFFIIFYFLIAILCTLSRSAILGLILSLIIYFIIKQKSIFVRIAFISLFSLILFITFPAIFDYLYSFNAKSSDNRTTLLILSITNFMNSPIFGFGLDKTILTETIQMETHNSYFQLLLYGGIFTFIIIFGTMFYYYYKILTFKIDSMHDASLISIKKFVSLSFPFMLVIFLFVSYVNIKYFWVYILILTFSYTKIHEFNKE